MPVYIRSGELDIPAPSISTLDSEDEDGVFLLDPELVVDELPQPFRMIDKILTGIVEDTWDVIVDRQVKREAELRRIKPPVYKPTSKIDEFSGSTCITHSGDERFLFVAPEAGGLVAHDAATHEKVAEWLCPDVCVETMTCKPIGPQCYLLATVDDMGFARLVLMASDTFHVVHIINEQIEGNPKSNAVKFELSSSGDYCGLSLQSGGSAWVDFYKLPRDTWMREVDNAQKESLKRAQMSNESIDNN
uniref:Uncharacterized protein n=1 Tax=Ciona savignyi TaxID=51511 RepID=H2YG23_CIOSA